MISDDPALYAEPPKLDVIQGAWRMLPALRSTVTFGTYIKVWVENHLVNSSSPHSGLLLLTVRAPDSFIASDIDALSLVTPAGSCIYRLKLSNRTGKPLKNSLLPDKGVGEYCRIVGVATV